MSTCCKATVIVDKDGLWCAACNIECKIDYDMGYVVKRRDKREFLMHFECDTITIKKEDVLSKRCTSCKKYLK